MCRPEGRKGYLGEQERKHSISNPLTEKLGAKRRTKRRSSNWPGFGETSWGAALLCRDAGQRSWTWCRAEGGEEQHPSSPRAKPQAASTQERGYGSAGDNRSHQSLSQCGEGHPSPILQGKTAADFVAPWTYKVGEGTWARWVSWRGRLFSGEWDGSIRQDQRRQQAVNRSVVLRDVLLPKRASRCSGQELPSFTSVTPSHSSGFAIFLGYFYLDFKLGLEQWLT